MLLVPGAIIALIGAHLYLVVKLGTTAPPWMRAESKPKSLREHTVGANYQRHTTAPMAAMARRERRTRRRRTSSSTR